MIKLIVKYLCISMTFIVFGIYLGQNKEFMNYSSNKMKEVSKELKKFNVMERASALKDKASKSTNRFFSKKNLSKTEVKKSKLINKWYYANGTDSFDSSLNARCLLKNYSVYTNGKLKTLNIFCQGKRNLQAQVRKNLKARIEKGI